MASSNYGFTYFPPPPPIPPLNPPYPEAPPKRVSYNGSKVFRPHKSVKRIADSMCFRICHVPKTTRPKIFLVIHSRAMGISLQAH